MSRSRSESLISETRSRTRACDHSGCLADGDFRAPRSRDTLDAFFWFCLEHVREYNAAWNYYAGMSEAEIEADLRNDTVWQRPTWPLGSRFSSLHGAQIRDDFGVTGESEPNVGGDRKNERKRPMSAQETALAVFEIKPPFTLVRLKSRYKELVKLHHPDANGGDKKSEERLKVINQAYATLKASYFS